MKSQHIYFTLINQHRRNVSLSKEPVYQDLCPSDAARNDGKTSRRGFFLYGRDCTIEHQWQKGVELPDYIHLINLDM